MSRRYRTVFAWAALAAGCAGSPSMTDTGHYTVAAQVVDRKTGQPVPDAPAQARASARSIAEPTQPVFRKLPPFREEVDQPTAAPPPRSPEEEALIGVARDRPFVPVDGRVNGQPVVMNFVGGDDRCRIVAVTYTTQGMAELWRVCADGRYALDREAEPIPSLPDDPGLQATRQAMMHWAYANGRAITLYNELTVKAEASGQRDANGCMTTRNAVIWNGITIGMNDAIVCSDAE